MFKRRRQSGFITHYFISLLQRIYYGLVGTGRTAVINASIATQLVT